MVDRSWSAMKSTLNSPPTSFLTASDDPGISESSWETSSTSQLSGLDRVEKDAKMTQPSPEAVSAQIVLPTRKKLFRLLDLPVDILKDIVKEINQTNDLTSLALTHSALHALVIPQMYSRFDIVWPDLGDDPEPRVGVDALAYGLSTLVMSGDVFGTGNVQGQTDNSCSACSNCGHSKDNAQSGQSTHHRTRRRGNNYAQFTRKFSLGNGPANLLEPYLISAESGKMLGTLVALAIARMQNLETFVWDMPTGVVREVWEALASLWNPSDGRPPRLTSVWLRCHDSKEVRSPTNYIHALPRLQMILGRSYKNYSTAELANNPLQAASADLESLRHSYRQIEHPNFSLLPPLRSVSILDIDQIAYYEELSVLVERSIECLRELRIGASSSFDPLNEHTQDGRAEGGLQKESGLSYLGAGGALGMIMSKFYDCRRKRPAQQKETTQENANPSCHIDYTLLAGVSPTLPGDAVEVAEAPLPLIELGATSPLSAPGSPIINNRLDASLPLDYITNPGFRAPDIKTEIEISNGTIVSPQAVYPSHETDPNYNAKLAIPSRKLSSRRRRLKLQILEMEKISLSVPVLQKALEWKFLTDLTLLHCSGDEELWKTLSRVFVPRPNHASSQPDAASPHTQEYPLKLKRIHTNGVSLALISFLRDNLAPNTLECLFLQDRAGYKASKKVKIESIYRGPLRRHRFSLRKVSIDSADKNHGPHAPTWKRWMLNRESMAFVMSGKMPNLRELAIAVDYADWHYFLQNLPQMPQLRSLYVPHINEHVHAHRLNAMELALQVLDIVTLRPDIELCYIGLLNKCFEILERKHLQCTNPTPSPPTQQQWHEIPMEGSISDDSSDDFSVHSGDSDEEDGANGSDEEDSEAASEYTVSDTEETSKEARLRLREILFFVEKVEIFKVRHGTL